MVLTVKNNLELKILRFFSDLVSIKISPNFFRIADIIKKLERAKIFQILLPNIFEKDMVYIDGNFCAYSTFLSKNRIKDAILHQANSFT